MTALVSDKFSNHSKMVSTSEYSVSPPKNFRSGKMRFIFLLISAICFGSKQQTGRLSIGIKAIFISVCYHINKEQAMTIDKSPDKIQSMFNKISDKYDFINNIMSFGTHFFIKKDCINLFEGKSALKILDLCCGTGDLTRIIKKKFSDAEVIGIDFSEKMLEIAKEKDTELNYLQADVVKLPFDDNSFDIITIAFGLRNIEDFDCALNEIYRVLKPNGQFLHLDFGEKNFLSSMFDKIVPVVTELFTKNNLAYSYLIKSKQEFYTPDELIKLFKNTGFKFLKRKDYLCKTISCQIVTKQA